MFYAIITHISRQSCLKSSKLYYYHYYIIINASRWQYVLMYLFAEDGCLLGCSAIFILAAMRTSNRTFSLFAHFQVTCSLILFCFLYHLLRIWRKSKVQRTIFVNILFSSETSGWLHNIFLLKVRTFNHAFYNVEK
jgi:hypothetical protein